CWHIDSSVHEATGVTPNQMMFGRQLTLPVELVMGSPNSNTNVPNTPPEYVQQLEERLQNVHEFARTRIKLSSDKMKRHYDLNVNENQIESGDAVWLFNPKRKRSLSPKLQCQWEGPYTVLKKNNDVIFKIQKNKATKPKIVHHDRLKPYSGGNQNLQH
ncbi:hypothetical protein FSP39_016879, partial [Pinctada imbricata]